MVCQVRRVFLTMLFRKGVVEKNQCTGYKKGAVSKAK